jgi:hypothetical protein
MTSDLFVGLVALALLPLIAMRIVRGLRDGRLPVYRTYLAREDDRTRFGLLLVLHMLSLIVIAVIASELLFHLGLRDRL